MPIKYKNSYIFFIFQHREILREELKQYWEIQAVSAQQEKQNEEIKKKREDPYQIR